MDARLDQRPARARKPDWWDILDWDEMGEEAFNRLPEEIKQKIQRSLSSEAQ